MPLAKISITFQYFFYEREVLLLFFFNIFTLVLVNKDNYIYIFFNPEATFSFVTYTNILII